MGHSCRALFVRDFLQKSHVKSPKRAFRTRLPPKVTSSLQNERFRTRLPPKVKRKHPSEHTRHAVLPSSFAIPAPPSNTHSHANPNATATFTSTTTHNLTIPCACHAPFRVHTSNCACHEMSPPSHLATSRFPAPATKNRTSTPQSPPTKYCACHEK